MFAPATIAAEIAAPDRVELFGKWIDEGGIVGENAVLKVALAFGLRAHARTGTWGSTVSGSEVRNCPGVAGSWRSFQGSW